MSESKLSNKVFSFLLKNTRFSEDEILEFHRLHDLIERSLEDLGAATCKSFGNPSEVLQKSFRSPQISFISPSV